MATVTTGLQGLDAQFNGGVPTGSTILVLAEPSNAPALFSDQFAAGGLNAGETVYYYNLERPKQDVVDHLRLFVPRPEAVKNLQYLDCYSVKMKDLGAAMARRLGLEDHAVKVTEDLPARLAKQPKGAPWRVVLESFTETAEAYGLEAALAVFKTLTALVRALDGVALVHAVKGMHDPTTEVRLRHLADGVIQFGTDRQGFGLYTFLSVTKMRGIQDATRLLLYKETDKGLWLESTRRVF